MLGVVKSIDGKVIIVTPLTQLPDLKEG